MRSKIIELEEELKIVGNNMKSLEIAEQEVRAPLIAHAPVNSFIDQTAELTKPYVTLIYLSLYVGCREKRGFYL